MGAQQDFQSFTFLTLHRWTPTCKHSNPRQAPVRVCLLALSTLALAAPANAKRSRCTADNYPTYECAVNLYSHTAAQVTLDPSCSRAHGFWAADRSRRVNLFAVGHWPAPGKVRMVTGPSVLGPLSASAHILTRSRLDLANRSRFPVGIHFTIDCP